MKVRFAVAPAGDAQEGVEIAEFADVLEASGFDGVWLSDVPLTSVLDPLLGLAMIAGRTSRVRLGANIVPLGRNPFLLAKELAQLDRLSGGRLLLSFVPGLDHHDEREVLGAQGAGRGAVLEEVLGLLRRWWAGEEVEHRSDRWTYHSVAPVARPVQRPLEVWLGGRGPRALERVGRIADGWLGAAITPEEARVARERIQQSAAGAGREVDPEHFGLSIPYARTAPDSSVLRGLGARRPDIDPLALLPVGSQALRELILRHIDAGLSKFVVRPAAVAGSWRDEIDWLAGAILHLQT
jgi:probable F420-dependent oxidoreductase